MSLDRSKYYGHWVPLSCYDIQRLDRKAVSRSESNTRKNYASRLIHFYKTHPITHIRLTGSVMSVDVRTINNDIHGKLSVSLEVDDGSGETVVASFLWRGDMGSVKAHYDKLLHKTVSVRGTPFTRFWNEGKVVSLDLKSVDLLDFAGEMEAIDNRMYTLEQLNLSPAFDYTHELPEEEQADVKFLDYEVMSFKNAVSFTDVEKAVIVEDKNGGKVQGKEQKDKKEKGTGAEHKGDTEELGRKDNEREKDKGAIEEVAEVQDHPQYPNLAQLFRLPSAGKAQKTVQLPDEVIVIEEDEDSQDMVDKTNRHGESNGHSEIERHTDLAEVIDVEEIDILEQELDEPVTEQTPEKTSVKFTRQVAGRSTEKSEQTDHNNNSLEAVTIEPPADTGGHVEVLSSDSDIQFGIMNKFILGKSSSPDGGASTSSSPIVVEFSSSNSKDGSQSQEFQIIKKLPKSAKKPSSEPSTHPTPQKTKITPTKSCPKFKYTDFPALKRRRYTPDTA
jgi:hypothetical protein